MLERTVSVKSWGQGRVYYSQRETERTGLRIGREDPMRQELVHKRKMLETLFTPFGSLPRINPTWSPT